MPMGRRQIYILIAKALLVVIWLGIFLLLAPWMDAKPIEEATPKILSALPLGCRAFFVNHGQYQCFQLGTRQQNPLGFWLLTLIFLCPFIIAGVLKTKAAMFQR